MTIPRRSFVRFRWVALLIACIAIAFIVQSSTRAKALVDTPILVRLVALSACLQNGTWPEWHLGVGGQNVGSVAAAPDCTFTPALRVVQSTDPAVLEKLTHPACTDVSAVFTGSALVSWVRVEVVRSESGTQTFCFFDHQGGSCNVNNLSSAGWVQLYGNQWGTGPAPDSDGDDLTNCVDTDTDGDGLANNADLCPLVADPTNQDSDSDGIGNACEDMVRTVPWLGDPNKPHEVHTGGQVILQGTATAGYTDTPLTLTDADWKPGDGSPSVDIDHSNALALEHTHTYTGLDGQPFTATLTVTTSTGATLTDTFKVVVKNKTIDVEGNMAIDKGLWYLHKQLQRGVYAGVPYAYVLHSADGGLQAGHLASSAAALQSMEINNHVTTGPVAQDPYIHDVSRLQAWLEAQLTPHTLSLQGGNNPDTNGNNKGVYPYSGDINSSGSHINYIVGQVADAFVASGTPTQKAKLGGPEIKGKQYSALVQDMLDFSSWSQLDAGTQKGSWYYSAGNDGNPAGSHADNSIAQWPAIGGIAAERVWGLSTPQWVKDNVLSFLPNTYNTAAQGSFSNGLVKLGMFGYADRAHSWSEGAATTPSALVQYIWAGVPKDPTPDNEHEQRAKDGFDYVARYHRIRNNYSCCDTMGHINGINFYALYATTKAYRLALNQNGQPQPVTFVDDNPADSIPPWHWYYNDPPTVNPQPANGPVGVARAVIKNQEASGRFPGTYHWSGNLSTAWGVIILSPSLFQAGPAAVCTANPPQIGSFGGIVNFSGTNSFHNDDDGTIVSHEWDFADGTGATGANVSHNYGASGTPRTFNASLTVTDANGLTDTAICPVTQVNTNVAPNADAGGPYTFCQGRPMSLNGMPSSDQEDGFNVTFAWDYTDTNGVNFTPVDATSTIVDVTAYFSGRGPGTYDVALRVTDTLGASNSEFTKVTVLPAGSTSCNTPPVATNNTYTANEDTGVSGNVVTNAPADSDVDAGQTLVASVVSGVSFGQLTSFAANGAFTYTPDANYCGQDTFTYKVNDGFANSNVAIVTLNITCVPDPPVAGDDAVSTNEDTALNGSVKGNDTAVDPEGDTLTWTKTSNPANGTLAFTNGTFTYTPNENFCGTNSFGYTLSDGTASDAATVTITVVCVNDPPVANDNTHTTAEDTPVSGTATSTDVDGGARTYSRTSGPSHGSVTVNADGSYTYTPAANYHGPDSFTFTANDGNGGTDLGAVSITVTPVNDAPVAGDDSFTTSEDTAVTASVKGNDTTTDVDGEILFWSNGNNPAHGALSFNNGTFTYTPGLNYCGPDSFFYRVSDGKAVVVATVSITVTCVNDPPVAGDDSAATSEDTPVSGSVKGNDTAADVDGDTLTWTRTTNPANGTLAFTNGSYTYTPNANYCGPDGFTYSIGDGTASDPAAVAITVACVNDAPVAADDAHTTAEDTPVPGTAASTDVDGGAPVYTLLSGPSHGVVALAPGGSYTYTPAANYHGPDAFTFSVSDGSGGSDSGEVTITVTPVNDAPAAADDSASTSEDTAVNGSVTGNDTAVDPDGDTLSWSRTSAPSNGTVSFANGLYTYTPNADFCGSDSFGYEISDGHVSAPATVSIAVSCVNDPPVAEEDANSTPEDTPVSGSVAGNDSDLDSASLAWSKVWDPAYGAVTVTADGGYTYTPNANYCGTDSFGYAVNDGAAGDEATATITITCVNDAPVAGDDTNTTDEDHAVSGSVKANDTAVDLDGDTLTWTKTSDPANGSVSFSNGSYTYTPNANFCGSDAFGYSIGDGIAGDGATVSIAVSCVNDAPVANDNSHTTPEDTTVTATAASTDIDGGAPVYSLVAGPSNGTLTFNADGTYSYRPNNNYHGPDAFTFRVADGAGGVDVGQVSVTVTPVNDAPICTAASPSISTLWPANHQLVNVTINGVVDPVEGSAITIRVDSIFQDEPTNTQGDGNTPVDGYGVGTPIAQVRAERAGNPKTPGNGRMYHVSFTGTDAQGGTCTGTVKVGVPHDQGKGSVVIDGGPLFRSTAQ